MQEDMHDWFNSENNGCCLNCPDAIQGCLCFSCKCRQCYWYSASEYDEKRGTCDLAEKFKKRCPKCNVRLVWVKYNNKWILKEKGFIPMISHSEICKKRDDNIE